MLRKLAGFWFAIILASAALLATAGIARGDEVPGADDAGTTVDTGVTAVLSEDEKVVRLTAKGDAFEDAPRVAFDVWSEVGGKESLIRHRAVQLEDGSWTATAYVASDGPWTSGVPYNFRVANAVHRLYNPYTGQHLVTMGIDEADALARAGWRYEGVEWVELPMEADDPDAGDGGDGDADAPTTADPGQSSDAVETTATVAPAAYVATDAATNGETTGVVATDDLADAPGTPEDPDAPGTPGTPGTPETPGDGEGATDEAVRQPVYRLYNRYTGDHFYTTSKAEYDGLAAAGWNPEDVSFYSAAEDDEAVAVYRVFNPYQKVGAHHFTASENEYRTLVGAGWKDEGVAWYGDPVNEDGTWCAEAGNRFHNDPGVYHVEAHVIEPAEAGADAPADGEADVLPGTPADGEQGTEPEPTPTPTPTPKPEATPKDTVAGEASFTVSRPDASARIANVQDSKGSYDVIVGDFSSPSGIAHVYAPTWTDARGQDDIAWYEATPQGDGTYKATANVSHHTFDKQFTTHVYVTAGNGVMVNVAQLSHEFSFANYVKKTGGPYTYKISIYNVGNVSRVRMPTWSDAGGQDDIVWYDAKNEGNGWWTATIDASRLAHSGLVHTHIYADDQIRGNIDFTVQSWEILAWKYRNMFDKIRNMSSSTRYLIGVDTGNCFIGVFEGGKGSWKNRFWWDCAPGTWATPTVKGTFKVGSRGYSFGSGFTCYYWTQFYNDYLFHSIKYYEGTFNVMDPTLGRPASHGCVRLAISNAKWIYDNVPSGTTVYVY